MAAVAGRAGAAAANRSARSALVLEILAAERLERDAAASRLEAWTRRFMPDAFFARPGEFHRALYSCAEGMLWGRELDGEVRTACAIACPRGHGKSTAMVAGLPLWVALEWANMPEFNGSRPGSRRRAPFIVLVSDTLDQARSRLMDIREQLEGNDRIIQEYGDQTPEAGRRTERQVGVGVGAGRRVRGALRKWTETHIELANGVVIRAMGFGSKVRGLVRNGRRPSLIIADDMENDEAVLTDKRRGKLLNWFTRSLIPCGKAGELLTIVVGTILHADSLLARLLSGDHFPGWLKRRYAAQYDEATGLPSASGGRVLWPEYWTLAQLEARRREIGSLAFAHEYLNQPIDAETAIFRWEWLTAGLNRGRGVPFLYGPAPRIPYDVTCSTWDPVELAELAPAGAYQCLVTAWDIGLIDSEAAAQASDGDYSVGLTVGLTASDRFEVRRIYRRRGMSPNEFRERVIAEQQTVEADYVVIERNQAQRIHEIDLRNIGLPIVGHTTTALKSSIWEGVPGMALMWEQGRIDLCHATERERERVGQLVQELHGLGHEAHDDIVMALWIALTALRRWIRARNRQRRKLLGAPPPGYYTDAFPERDERRAA